MGHFLGQIHDLKVLFSALQRKGQNKYLEGLFFRYWYLFVKKCVVDFGKV